MISLCIAQQWHSQKFYGGLKIVFISQTLAILNNFFEPIFPKGGVEVYPFTLPPTLAKSLKLNSIISTYNKME